jgi:hypothetical protein
MDTVAASITPDIHRPIVPALVATRDKPLD